VTPAGAIEGLAHRERATILIALLTVIIISIVFMLRSGDALMMMPGTISAQWIALLFVMWWTMMLAMMLPSAAPAILTFGAVSRRLDGRDASARMLAFASGYALVWTGFSLAAVALQMAADRILQLNPMFATTSQILGGVLLIAAGLYQLTPLKEACLRKCQMPLLVFARNWRPGLGGALRMGLGHGLYCVGGCAVLMAVLFYGGVMEPIWIAGLALYVLIEKLVPRRWYLSRFAGIVLCLWGGAVLWMALR
jgi:predicted metal-binding membrane protein